MKPQKPDPVEVSGFDAVTGLLQRIGPWHMCAPFGALVKEQDAGGWPRLKCFAFRAKGVSTGPRSRAVIMHAALYERENAWEVMFAYSIHEGGKSWTDSFHVPAQEVCDDPPAIVKRVNEKARAPRPETN